MILGGVCGCRWLMKMVIWWQSWSILREAPWPGSGWRRPSTTAPHSPTPSNWASRLGVTPLPLELCPGDRALMVTEWPSSAISTHRLSLLKLRKTVSNPLTQNLQNFYPGIFGWHWQGVFLCNWGCITWEFFSVQISKSLLKFHPLWYFLTCLNKVMLLHLTSFYRWGQHTVHHNSRLFIRWWATCCDCGSSTDYPVLCLLLSERERQCSPHEENHHSREKGTIRLYLHSGKLFHCIILCSIYQ